MSDVRHMYALEKPICGQVSAVEAMASNVRIVYGSVDCPDCLRRLIAEAEARVQALRDLLSIAEGDRLS